LAGYFPPHHEPLFTRLSRAIINKQLTRWLFLLDADDEAMQRYKASLGLGGTGKDLSDPNDPRHCIILSLTMDSEGRPPTTIDLAAKGSEATLKDKPFKIKEGVKFSMTAKFKVQHEILSGLHYVQIVKRRGIRVSKDQEMIVSFFPFFWAGRSASERGADAQIGFFCS
jgi:hypothetical protein